MVLPPLFLYGPSNSHILLFNHKLLSIGVIFSYNLYSSHTLAWMCMLHLTDYSYYLFLLYLSHFLIQFNTTCTITVYPCVLYKLSITIFRLILLLKVTLGSLLHSRVKHSITPILVVICSPNSRADCYTTAQM